MKKRLVISRKVLPAKFPLLSTALAYLYLDKFQPAGWVWGAAGALYLLIWISTLYVICISKEVHPSDVRQLHQN